MVSPLVDSEILDSNNPHILLPWIINNVYTYESDPELQANVSDDFYVRCS